MIHIVRTNKGDFLYMGRKRHSNKTILKEIGKCLDGKESKVAMIWSAEQKVRTKELYRNGDYVSVTVDGVTYEHLGKLSTDEFLDEVVKCMEGEESLVSIKPMEEE